MELWMPGAEKILTAAYGGYGEIQPIACVNHVMQGYQGTMIRWAMERPYVKQKSAHFTIGRNGRIVQHVPLNQASWASGSIRSPQWRLLKGKTNPNSYIVNIEHEGFSKPPGYGYDYVYDQRNPWPEAMVKASVSVQRWVCNQLHITPTFDTIIGHRRIDSVTRADDPGTMWPQARIIKLLEGKTSLPPINKNLAYWEIFRGNAKAVRREGDYGIYELKVKA